MSEFALYSAVHFHFLIRTGEKIKQCYCNNGPDIYVPPVKLGLAEFMSFILVNTVLRKCD